jgi:hypothetical protein
MFPSTGAPSGTHDQFGFVLDDLAGTLARLKDAGIEPAGIPGSAWFDGDSPRHGSRLHEGGVG